jgi:carbohydrate-selective porin OprB
VGRDRGLIPLALAALLGAVAVVGALPPTAARGAEAEPASIWAKPDHAADLWSRRYLMGDWGGSRTTLADHGVTLHVDMVRRTGASSTAGSTRTNTGAPSLSATALVGTVRPSVRGRLH